MNSVKYVTFICLAAIAALCVAAGAQTPPVNAAALLEHIKFLASDDLKGRASGTPELERAADYIASQFRDAGLSPGVDGNSWFQPFQLDAGVRIGRGNSLVVRGGASQVELTLGMSYYPLAAPANNSPSVASTSLKGTDLAFVGYGISAPGLRYDDYADIDVRGKAVIAFSHEPQERSRTSRLNGNQPIPETSLYAKATAARNRGAVALLIVTDPVHTADDLDYGTFVLAPDADNLGIPVLRVRRDTLAPLVAAWDLEQLAREIDQDLRPRSRVLAGASVDYSEFLSRDTTTVRNVVGVLRAPGALGQEALVIGAHYDHVGLGGRYSVVPERTGEIHNGADDNASGTAAIIEMARAATADRSRFPRTLIFVAFAGEERGLLGSSYYVSHPVMPLAGTVTMLNLDMVGRLKGSVDVSGLDAAPVLLREIGAASRSINLPVRQEGPGAGRSDDFPFLEAGVPAVNFFTGFHSDYHSPTDDWQRINVDGTARVANLALELAARLAARPDRSEFTQPRR